MRRLHWYIGLPLIVAVGYFWAHCQHTQISSPDSRGTSTYTAPIAETAPVAATVSTRAGTQAAVATTPAVAAAPAVANVPPTDERLRTLLAGMARAHDQKTQLAFYESMPWRKTSEPYHSFYVDMGKTQGELLADIRGWAKAHHMDLTFHFPADAEGKAQQILEARQEKLVRGDSNQDFVRDTLMQMYDDYEWQISLIQALLPYVQDPGLKAYLQKSQKVHEEGSARLVKLLQRFK